MRRLFAALTVSLVAACSSSSSSSSPPSDAGTTSSDAAADAVATDADDGGGACNGVDDAAPTITVSEEQGTAPLGTGGALVDGTYFTTAEAHYRASANDPPSVITMVKETVVLTGASASGASGTYVFVANGDDAHAQRINVTITTSGSGIAFVATCPATGADHTFDSYTATPTTVTLYSSMYQLAVTLTKQ